ncbi:MAG TPA: lytic transglycosylase domain-containing protein [Solirubrobacteraceae bacterium]|jgi:soluble lytic murein transglycosylase-like protein
MSVESVMARISEIQAMINGGVAQTTAAPVAATATTTTSDLTSATGGATFAGALAAASDTTGSDASAATLAAPAAGASALPAGTPFAAQITASAQRNGIDPALLAGLIKQESGFNPNAGSPAGAQGLTQLMPGTARGLGVSNPLDPAQSIEGGARYLKQQLDHFGGDVARALAAYNAGPGAVQRYGGVPPYAETQNYVRRVQAYAAAFRSNAS